MTSPEMSQEIPSWESENLVSRVRHDLLQPAAAMKLLLSRLEDTASLEEVRGLAKILNRSVNELDQTVQRIADHMMLSNGLIEPRPCQFNIRHWFFEETAKFADQARAAGLEFSMDVPDQTVTMDNALLGRVIGELIENAIDFTKTGSISILVETSPEIMVSIRDTGIGLPKTPVSILKKPYYTEQAEKARRQNRLGIGLAQASLAAELLRGTIVLRADDNNHGTAAIATFPG